MIQPVQYEGVDNLCLDCGLIEKHADGCGKGSPGASQGSTENTTTSKQKMEMNKLEKYGEWMIVTAKKEDRSILDVLGSEKRRTAGFNALSVKDKQITKNQAGGKDNGVERSGTGTSVWSERGSVRGSERERQLRGRKIRDKTQRVVEGNGEQPGEEREGTHEISTEKIQIGKIDTAIFRSESLSVQGHPNFTNERASFNPLKTQDVPQGDFLFFAGQGQNEKCSQGREKQTDGKSKGAKGKNSRAGTKNVSTTGGKDGMEAEGTTPCIKLGEGSKKEGWSSGVSVASVGSTRAGPQRDAGADTHYSAVEEGFGESGEGNGLGGSPGSREPLVEPIIGSESVQCRELGNICKTDNNIHKGHAEVLQNIGKLFLIHFREK